jgi:lipid II:glycine glycyltransferase (peptidoglycan interpeptide bridge formation enzyme)
MDRNQALEFYYFNDSYFTKCLALDTCEPQAIFHDNVLISAGLFFYSGDTAHYHLSGNTQEGLAMNANYLLLEGFFERARSRGCKLALLGGGRTTADDDSLLRFKQKFSPLTLPFYVAGKIFNTEAYAYLSRIREKHGAHMSTTRFLKYR